MESMLHKNYIYLFMFYELRCTFFRSHALSVHQLKCLFALVQSNSIIRYIVYHVIRLKLAKKISKISRKMMVINIVTRATMIHFREAPHRISLYYIQTTQAKCSNLKLKFMKYPAIYTNYIIYHCTTLPYIIIIFDTVLRQKRNIEHEK